MAGYTHPKWYNQLVEDLNVYLHTKNHFFFNILHFKESCNLIGGQHFGLKNQNFARYGIGGEMSVAILVFILDYFEEILMKNFQKNLKNLILGAILDLFCSNFDKNEFSWEKKLSVFKYSKLFTTVPKIRKNKLQLNELRLSFNSLFRYAWPHPPKVTYIIWFVALTNMHLYGKNQLCNSNSFSDIKFWKFWNLIGQEHFCS